MFATDISTIQFMSNNPPPAVADLPDCYRGCLLGLAVGDALGTTLEFCAPGTFAPLTDMVGGGPFGLKAGQWTDDTSMALCLAESLLECGGFDARDQMRRYCRWQHEGYLSSTGTCFDIGGTVSSALRRFEREENASGHGDPYAGSTDPHTAGNGSLMRLAPVPLFFAAAGPQEAIARAAESSRTTHGAAAAVDSCRYMAALILGALAGASKAELLAPFFAPAGASEIWQAAPLAKPVAAVAAGSFRTKPDGQIRGTGYVVASLEAALWAFARSSSFEEGALLAVNLGEDADTTGAIFGQLAGAFYGESGIPARWLDKLCRRDFIAGLADQLRSPPSRRAG
jgi:ADP-ribosyl-[dinitrogen reductase] hydrolase